MPPTPKKPLVLPQKNLVKVVGKPVSVEPQKKIAPLKTGVERPVLRAFECLVHIEQAKSHLDQVGIYVGEDSEKMHQLRNQVSVTIEELRGLYRQYWNKVSIDLGE